MDDRERMRWARILALIMVVLIAAAAFGYRLVREGRWPMPSQPAIFAGIAALLLLPAAGFFVYRRLVGETEDAAALRRLMADREQGPRMVRDYSRDYPLVFRPEWIGVAASAAMPGITLLLGVWQSERLAQGARLVALGCTAAAFGLFIVLYMSRRLTISWQGVTLKEIRRERFWAWDQIDAVVLLERRGKRRPALRLRTLIGEPELVELGGIDFAREDVLFDALISRVRHMEVDTGDRIIRLTPGPHADLGALVEALLADAPAAAEAEEPESPVGDDGDDKETRPPGGLPSWLSFPGPRP